MKVTKYLIKTMIYWKILILIDMDIHVKNQNWQFWLVIFSLVPQPTHFSSQMGILSSYLSQLMIYEKTSKHANIKHQFLKKEHLDICENVNIDPRRTSENISINLINQIL